MKYKKQKKNKQNQITAQCFVNTEYKKKLKNNEKHLKK